MPIFIKKIKKNNFIKLILIFLILRSISSFITFKFLQFYDSRIFSFTDLAFYNDNDLDIFSPNFLYAYFVRSIGYNQETLLSFKFIFLSFLFSVISVLPYLFLSTKILSKKNSLFFIFILAFHPYLSLYSLKIDSNIFATFAIGFYSLWIFYSNNLTFNLSLLSNSFGVLLRNALIPFFWIQFILIVILKKKYFRNNLLLITSLFFLTLIISSSQFFYGIEYMSQNFGCYSYENINAFFSDFFNPYISNFISLISTPIIHLILNLGAREAISINCLNLPSEYVSNQFMNIFITFSFLLFHSYLLIKLLIFVFKDFNLRKLALLFPLSILLPTLYGTAHMRYLYPLIPFLIFVQLLPKNFQIKEIK